MPAARLLLSVLRSHAANAQLAGSACYAAVRLLEHGGADALAAAGGERSDGRAGEGRGSVRGGGDADAPSPAAGCSAAAELAKEALAAHPGDARVQQWGSEMVFRLGLAAPTARPLPPRESALARLETARETSDFRSMVGAMNACRESRDVARAGCVAIDCAVAAADAGGGAGAAAAAASAGAAGAVAAVLRSLRAFGAADADVAQAACGALCALCASSSPASSSASAASALAASAPLLLPPPADARDTPAAAAASRGAGGSPAASSSNKSAAIAGGGVRLALSAMHAHPECAGLCAAACGAVASLVGSQWEPHPPQVGSHFGSHSGSHPPGTFPGGDALADALQMGALEAAVAALSRHGSHHAGCAEDACLLIANLCGRGDAAGGGGGGGERRACVAARAAGLGATEAVLRALSRHKAAAGVVAHGSLALTNLLFDGARGRMTRRSVDGCSDTMMCRSAQLLQACPPSARRAWAPSASSPPAPRRTACARTAAEARCRRCRRRARHPPPSRIRRRRRRPPATPSRRRRRRRRTRAPRRWCASPRRRRRGAWRALW